MILVYIMYVLYIMYSIPTRSRSRIERIIPGSMGMGSVCVCVYFQMRACLLGRVESVCVGWLLHINTKRTGVVVHRAEREDTTSVYRAHMRTQHGRATTTPTTKMANAHEHAQINM